MVPSLGRVAPRKWQNLLRQRNWTLGRASSMGKQAVESMNSRFATSKFRGFYLAVGYAK
jgi:hypothetical protein